MYERIVILAGGASSRMKKQQADVSLNPQSRKEVQEKPKAMLAVGHNGRPFLDFLLQNVEKAGYKQVVIVVGENDNSIRSHYYDNEGSRQFPALDIGFVVQQVPANRAKPLGTADALMQALHAYPQWKGERITVCNADNLYSAAALSLLANDDHENAMIDYDRAGLNFPEERIAQFAVINKDEAGFLTDIIEKPTREELDHLRDASGRVGVSMNIWRLQYELILPYLENLPLHHVRQEKELPVAVRAMIRDFPRSVFALPLTEHVADLTMQADIPVVQQYLRTLVPSRES